MISRPFMIELMLLLNEVAVRVLCSLDSDEAAGRDAMFHTIRTCKTEKEIFIENFD